MSNFFFFASWYTVAVSIRAGGKMDSYESRFCRQPIRIDSQISNIDSLKCYTSLTSDVRVLLITIRREKGLNAVLPLTDRDETRAQMPPLRCMRLPIQFSFTVYCTCMFKYTYLCQNAHHVEYSHKHSLVCPART